MGKLVVILLLIVVSFSAFAEAEKEWVLIAKVKNEDIYINSNSFSVKLDKFSGNETSEIIVQYVNKKDKTTTLNNISVNSKDCKNKYGFIHVRDMGGSYITRGEFAFGAKNLGSQLAQISCKLADLYSSTWHEIWSYSNESGKEYTAYIKPNTAHFTKAPDGSEAFGGNVKLVSSSGGLNIERYAYIRTADCSRIVGKIIYVGLNDNNVTEHDFEVGTGELPGAIASSICPLYKREAALSK